MNTLTLPPRTAVVSRPLSVSATRQIVRKPSLRRDADRALDVALDRMMERAQFEARVEAALDRAVAGLGAAA